MHLDPSPYSGTPKHVWRLLFGMFLIRKGQVVPEFIPFMELETCDHCRAHVVGCLLKPAVSRRDSNAWNTPTSSLQGCRAYHLAVDQRLLSLLNIQEAKEMLLVGMFFNKCLLMTGLGTHPHLFLHRLLLALAPPGIPRTAAEGLSSSGIAETAAGQQQELDPESGGWAVFGQSPWCHSNSSIGFLAARKRQQPFII